MTDQVLGRVALVTGGSRGIGRAIAVALAKQGVKVAINWGTNEFAAQQTLEEGRAGGGDGDGGAHQHRQHCHHRCCRRSLVVHWPLLAWRAILCRGRGTPHIRVPF